jgi:tRNA (guanine37-N1)-methyltransferase
VFRAPCLKVPKALGEKAIFLIRKLALFNRELKVQLLGDSLCIPLVSEPTSAQIKEIRRAIPEFEISVHDFPEQMRRPLRFIDILGDKLPPHLLASLPRSIDFVGEIAVVEVPPELESYKEVLGEAILATHKRTNTVLAKLGAVKGDFRLREFKVLAGKGKTETIHREYGCIYYLDLAKVYFSPRLGNEHNRVASQVKEGETVVDMFAGVGPFSILIAKKHENVKVYSIDKNPDAITYLKRNIEANRVQGKVVPILGDAKETIKEGLKGKADRAIMNLPEKAIEYVDAACETIKPEGGTIHYYEFSNSPNPMETAKSRFIEATEKAGRNVKEVLSARIVREAAPFTWQIAVDAEIQ